jgi:hypothetical protein
MEANRTVDAEKIPEISDKKLEALRKTIRPLVIKDGKLHYASMVDPRNVSFAWSAAKERAEDVEPFAVIRTIHEYGAPVCFKPSEAEVLSQMPEKLTKEAVAYLTVSPARAEHALTEDTRFHVARTVLYRRSEKAAEKSEDDYIGGIMACLDKGDWNGAYLELAVPPKEASDLRRKFGGEAKRLLAVSGIVDDGFYYRTSDFVITITQLIRYAEEGGSRLVVARKLADLMLSEVVVKGNGEHSNVDLPEIEFAYLKIAEAHERRGEVDAAKELRAKAEKLKEINDVWDEVALDIGRDAKGARRPS